MSKNFANRWQESMLALVVVLFAAPVHAEAPDKFYEKTAPSIWRVFSFDKQGARLGQGSAVVIGPETLLTNCHVIAKASSFTINQNNQSFGARLQYIDVERDLCQISARNLKAPAVVVGDSNQVVVGQRVYTIGNPVNMEQTLSDGLVSALRRDKENQLTYIQISAPISHGSSGGGLFDENGKLVGITSAGIDAGQNVNFAIPINWLKELPARSQAALEKYKVVNADSGKAVNVAEIAATAPAQKPAIPAPPPVAVRPATPELNDIFKRVPVPTASGFADLNDIAKLDQFGARKGYEKFLKVEKPRAFAIVEGGTGWWYSSGTRPKNPASSPEPHIRAVKDCEEKNQKPCYLYAVDDAVVYKSVRDIAAYTGATPIPAPSGYASISDIGKLEKFGVKDGYEEFLSKSFPRAFAITGDGKYFLANGTTPKSPESSTEPHVRVISLCESYYKRRCYLYAVNGVVVFQPPRDSL